MYSLELYNCDVYKLYCRKNNKLFLKRYSHKHNVRMYITRIPFQEEGVSSQIRTHAIWKNVFTKPGDEEKCSSFVCRFNGMYQVHSSRGPGARTRHNGFYRTYGHTRARKNLHDFLYTSLAVHLEASGSANNKPVIKKL